MVEHPSCVFAEPGNQPRLTRIAARLPENRTTASVVDDFLGNQPSPGQDVESEDSQVRSPLQLSQQTARGGVPARRDPDGWIGPFSGTHRDIPVVEREPRMFARLAPGGLERRT